MEGVFGIFLFIITKFYFFNIIIDKWEKNIYNLTFASKVD